MVLIVPVSGHCLPVTFLRKISVGKADPMLPTETLLKSSIKLQLSVGNRLHTIDRNCVTSLARERSIMKQRYYVELKESIKNTKPGSRDRRHQKRFFPS